MSAKQVLTEICKKLATDKNWNAHKFGNSSNFEPIFDMPNPKRSSWIFFIFLRGTTKLKYDRMILTAQG